MHYGEEIKTIARALRQRQAVLFVGAGVSMSVGLPSSTRLVDHLLADLGIDKLNAGNNTTTLQTIAEYYRLKRGSFTPLVDWMNEEWQVSTNCLFASRLHRLVVELDFPIIYTTNYDANLENSYQAFDRSFVKITSAADMAAARPGMTQIVKYHGDFSNPETLVITESDYFDRLAFDAPMDIKFRGDAFASTLLFIGYSMSDLNIRFMLHRLWSIWRRAGDAAQRPPLFLFMHDPDDVQRHVLENWGVTVLDGDGKDAEDSLLSFLGGLHGAVQREKGNAEN